jgi:hypothetical protein
MQVFLLWREHTANGQWPGLKEVIAAHLRVSFLAADIDRLAREDKNEKFTYYITDIMVGQ